MNSMANIRESVSSHIEDPISFLTGLFASLLRAKVVFYVFVKHFKHKIIL